MATIRVSNIEAKADAGSPTIDERVTFKRSTGENGVVIDSKQVGITSVGINTDNPQAVLDVSGGAIISGKVGIGTDDPKTGIPNVVGLHVYTGASGQTGTNSANLIVEDSDDAEIALLCPSTNVGRIKFGDENSANRGQIRYDHTDDSMQFTTGANAERLRITTGGNVGIGTDNPSETLDVNGNISSIPIFITTYGAGNLDITTEQTVDLDLTLSTSGTSDFTVSATGVITVLKTGTYQVSYSISTDVTSGSARSTSTAYLRLNGSGEQTASRTYMYNRQSGAGENTAAKTIMLSLTANDTLELRAVRNSGTDTVVILEDYTTISLVRLT